MAPSFSKIAPQAVHVTAPAPGAAEPFSVTLEGTSFQADGHPFLTQVPPNIVSTPVRKGVGSFVGFDADRPDNRHVCPVGKLQGINFMSIFRFKVWWTTHWVGSSGRHVENETQMLLLDKSDRGRPYVLLLPLLEGPFRASLQAGRDDDVDICVESGSTRVVGSSFRSVLYIQAGPDPFQLVNDAVKAIRNHLGTFNLLEEKTPPGIVDKFGWCTWDAFYLKVNPAGIYDGVKNLVAGGCPPGLVLIDDGWQSISHDNDPDTDQEGVNYTVAGEQMPCRLLKFEENYKFRDYRSSKSPGEKGLGAFVRDLKDEFKSVEYVYVWHALCGYWGGLRPGFPGLPGCEVVIPKLSPGLQMTMEDLAVDKIVRNGVGMVPPEKVGEMYEGLHSHLEASGIDGVKVDVIHLLEMLAEEFGGRVELAKTYYKALTASMRKHFKGNGVIASMEHCNDFMYLGTEAIALGRVGDDFWSSDPQGVTNGTYWLQGCHMVHCAYNSLWMGNFIQPDWDMFQTTHPCAEFHAASRAISGGPIYISDCVGKHDFELLKTLVLPDGSILRCQSYALPTRDCLFANPSHDGKTVLKIWNLNKFTGVLGAFNCQGGGWCPETRKNKLALEAPQALTCSVSPKDVEWGHGNGKNNNPICIKGVDVFAVYMYKQKKVELLKSTGNLEISIGPFEYEILTVSPVRVLEGKCGSIRFAPIGLVNMLNSSGAIESVSYDNVESRVTVEVRGSGEFKVFASEKPRSCTVNGEMMESCYEDHVIAVRVNWSDSSKLTIVEYLF